MRFEFRSKTLRVTIRNPKIILGLGVVFLILAVYFLQRAALSCYLPYEGRLVATEIRHFPISGYYARIEAPDGSMLVRRIRVQDFVQCRVGRPISKERGLFNWPQCPQVALPSKVQ